MPIDIRPDSHPLCDGAQHYKDYCYGATYWKDEEESRSDGPLLCPLYIVEGTEIITLDEEGTSISADGYWCEECCRARGWLW